MTGLSDIEQAWKDRGCDLNNVFVRHVIAAGGFPPVSSAGIERRALVQLCPISSDVPFPGKALPLPPGHDRRPIIDVLGCSAGSRYHFDLMAVGDSFEVKHPLDPACLRSAAYAFSRAHGVVLKFRRGRCWRLR